jgi:hypothetical protein
MEHPTVCAQIHAGRHERVFGSGDNVAVSGQTIGICAFRDSDA